ncbi:MAG: alpha/beta hydrolase, partial [Chloroflexi bacterium]|nr:alpha/beta hydrolase [Chloroflexota bacterium]
MDIGSVSPEKAVSRLGYPILVIHGTDDTRIPLEQGLRVYRAAHPGSRLWVAHGVEHVEAFKTYPDEYAQRVAGYFEERVGTVNVT